jgi:hypothetical protein
MPPQAETVEGSAEGGGIVIPEGVDVKTHAGASGRFTAIAQRRNQIFDANIARQLDRVRIWRCRSSRPG